MVTLLLSTCLLSYTQCLINQTTKLTPIILLSDSSSPSCRGILGHQARSNLTLTLTSLVPKLFWLRGEPGNKTNNDYVTLKVEHKSKLMKTSHSM